MKKHVNNGQNFPSLVLLILGFIDLIRGILHTFVVDWASQTFAHLDLSVARNDQLWLLGTFGISNILTGLIYILISRKAPQLAPYILLLIPITYLLGIIGLRSANVTPEADFTGKYPMLLYLALCSITALAYFFKKQPTSKEQ